VQSCNLRLSGILKLQLASKVPGIGVIYLWCLHGVGGIRIRWTHAYGGGSAPCGSP